jgi:hypothetical protein
MKQETEVVMQATTQPTTRTVGKGANGIFEGVQQFFHQFFRRTPPAELTRDQHIAAFIKGLKCNCGGTCGRCEHLIKDVFGG